MGGGEWEGGLRAVEGGGGAGRWRSGGLVRGKGGGGGGKSREDGIVVERRVGGGSVVGRWGGRGGDKPIIRTLRGVGEPVQWRVRKFLPFVLVKGLDLSPIVIILVFQFLD